MPKWCMSSLEVGAEVDVRIILINYLVTVIPSGHVETLMRMQIVPDCVPVNVL